MRRCIARLLCCPTLLALVAGFLTSCAAPVTRTTDAGSHFREAASVDAAFQFSRWDTIYMTRPDTRENGFYPIYTREDIAAQIASRTAGRNLAVVVMGYVFSDEIQQEIIHEWTSLLFAQGFKRVVMLRSDNTMHIQGLLIVADSASGNAHDAPALATTAAAIPPAP
jgi:hypothetical protein